MASLVLAVILGFAVRQSRQAAADSQTVRPAGIPVSVSTALADQMALSPVRHSAVPDFTLTDQYGQVVSLAQFRGRVVVLEFTDPNCTDVCPIVSQELVDAYHDLGKLAPNAVFLSVNVNPYHARVADMAAYSSEHGLNAVTTWHFVTGPMDALSAVWSNLEIDVQAPNPTADVVHSDTMYFIDGTGTERFVARPMVDHTSSGTAFLPSNQITSWGTGIALMVRSLVSG